MKAQDFGSHLKSLLQLLEAGGASDQVQALRHFIPLFSAAGKTMVEEVVTISKNVRTESCKAPVFSELVPLLSAYKEFIVSLGKKPFLPDLQAVLKLIEANANVSVEDFVIAYQDHLVEQKKRAELDLVEGFVRKIGEYYKDPVRFKSVYEELRARSKGKGMTDAAVRSVASRFSSNVKPNTTKSAALKLIQAFHDNYIELDLKNQAMGNRSAA
jgi:hypothetical protein